MKRIYIILLKLFVSLGLLAFVFTKIDFNSFVNVFHNIKLFYLFLALLLTFAGFLLAAWKWKIALVAQDIHIGFWTLVGSYMVGLFFGNVLPTSYGGDIIRIYDTAKLSKKKIKSFSSLLFDRLAGFFVLLLIGFIAILFVPEFIWLLPIIGILLLFFILLFLFSDYNLGKIKIFDYLFKKFDKKNVIVRIKESINIYKKKPNLLTSILLISLFLQLNVILFNFFIVKGLGLMVPLAILFVFVPLVNVLTIIPMSINGLGVREFSYVYLFGLGGVAKFEALFISLTVFFIRIVSSLFGGIVYVIRGKK